jgi:excisionase family DNA binding protein
MDRLLSMEEVAELLGVPVGTVRSWRDRGRGPRAVRVGLHLRYRRSDIENWLDGLIEQQATAKATRVRGASDEPLG